MLEIIKNFPKQFSFDPKIVGGEKLKKFKKFVVVGMGGSNLASEIIKARKRELSLTVHRDYGLPAIKKADLKRTLIIASSYSGNTEEVIDAFNESLKNNLSLLAITTGGKLLELAKNNKVPYIELPDTSIEPRFALGFSLRAFLKALGEERLLKETFKLTRSLRPDLYEAQARELANKFKGFVPIIYASTKNSSLAYNWKIKFNETVGIPAFSNVFPEINHNEVAGFDIGDGVGFSKNFCFLILKDSSDHFQILKRMDIVQKLLAKKGLSVEVLELDNKLTVFHKIFSSLILADFITYFLAKDYGTEGKSLVTIHELKK